MADYLIVFRKWVDGLDTFPDPVHGSHPERFDRYSGMEPPDAEAEPDQAIPAGARAVFSAYGAPPSPGEVERIREHVIIGRDAIEGREEPPRLIQSVAGNGGERDKRAGASPFAGCFVVVFAIEPERGHRHPLAICWDVARSYLPKTVSTPFRPSPGYPTSTIAEMPPRMAIAK